MLRACLFLLLAGVTAGCGDQSDSPSPVSQRSAPPEVPKGEPTPEVTKESEQVRVFKEKVATYLTEARAGAKLLTLHPSIDEARAKTRHVKDVYTRVPDVPAEIDATGVLAKKLLRINAEFALGDLYVKLRDDFYQLAVKEKAKECEGKCNKAAAEVNRYADEIEAILSGKAKVGDLPEPD